MRSLRLGVAAASVLTVLAGAQSAPPFRTLNDRFTPREYASLAEWQPRAAYLREHILASAGLLPMPEKAPLRAQVFGERRHGDYSVFKVYFESLPGFYVTGNLYRPAGIGRTGGWKTPTSTRVRAAPSISRGKASSSSPTT